MKHNFIYALAVLIISVAYLTSCSSDNDNSFDVIDNNATAKLHENTDWESLESPTIEDDWVTVIFLDSAEFAETLKIRDLRAPDRGESRAPGTVIFQKYGEFWKVIMELRGFSVIYDTMDKGKFIPEINAYRARYEKRSNEFYGQAYGRVRSDSEIDIYLDITQKVAPQQYEYAYTVGMNAKIIRGEFHLTPLGDL